MVMSSPLALISASVVLLAGAAYFVTQPTDKVEVHLTTTTAEPPKVAPRTTIEPKRAVPVVVNRKDTYVVVFNNSGISGLAARAAEGLAGAGWNVVGSDNWYGTIPASTVYYPESFKPEAELLAKDLQIERLKPAVDPMQGDRLTVILTPDFG
jgi:hypothetical protein